MPARHPPRPLRVAFVGAWALALALSLGPTPPALAADPPADWQSTVVVPSSAATWVQATRDTALYADSAADAQQVSDLPQHDRLRLLGTQADRAHVYYEGDFDGRAPGLAWAPAADLAPAQLAEHWYMARHPAALRPGPSERYRPIAVLPPGAHLEPLGREMGVLIKVRARGDGWDANHQPEGWMSLDDLVGVDVPDIASPAAPPQSLPERAYVDVPYHSQLDGSPYAAANCGPTVIQMALAYVGVPHSSWWLRQQVGWAQDWSGDDAGSNIWALAAVVRMDGAEPVGLFDGPARLGEDSPLHHWTLQDIRRQLAAGRPVIAQVSYRALPGREDAPYDGDHFLVLEGYDADGFTYNDPIDKDGPGADRWMSADTLDAALRANQEGIDHAAFAIAAR